MQYVKLYENPDTGAIDHVETTDVPFNGRPDGLSSPDIPYIVHEVELRAHPDGFKRARYLLERMEIVGGAPGFRAATSQDQRMEIVAATRKP